MFDEREKIVLLIDGANLYATSKALGFEIDYKQLMNSFQKRGYLLRAYYYTALIEDQEYSSIRPLIDWLDYNGFSVVTKAATGVYGLCRTQKGQGQHRNRIDGGRDGTRIIGRSLCAVFWRWQLPGVD